MATQEKHKAINRVEMRYAFRAAEEKMYQKTVEAAKSGAPTCWAMEVYWQTDTILKVMGFEIVYPENYGAYIAATGVAPEYLERSDSEGFPTHMCGYARANLGYTARMMDLGEIPPEAPAGGIPKPALLLSRGAVCDAGYKWFQALARYFDTPMWVTEHPHPGVKEFLEEGYYEHAINFMVEDLRKFVVFVERLLGKKMDWDKLSGAVCNIEQTTRIWHEVNELRKAVPGPMHSRDFWTCMVPHFYMASDEVAIELYRRLYDEVKYRVDNQIGAIAEEKYRLVFAELPPWHSLGFFDKLAERGWNFVIESLVFHQRPIDLTGVSDPLERLARIALQWNTSYFENALKAGEHFGFFGYPYLEYTKDYKCVGAFLHPLRTCRTASIALPYIQDRLMKKFKVPSLVVEGDIVDLKLFDPVAALRKAETLEETMEHYRRLRKEEGFDW